MGKIKNKNIKPHIGIFGKRNTGKSSLINYITGQDISIVSEIPGTTTDPTEKSIEISGIGPVVVIDTAGIDDEGLLGEKRVNKTLDFIKKIDVAILIFTDNNFGDYEKDIIKIFNDFEVPFIIIHNKSDLTSLDRNLKTNIEKEFNIEVIDFSTNNKDLYDLLADAIVKTIKKNEKKTISLLGDLINTDDIVLLITPIDNSAPEGRLILPQVQTIRDILDNNAISIVCKEDEAEKWFNGNFPTPKIVITDSQAFERANKIVPENTLLTSFSILLARQKANFEAYINGTFFIDKLKDGDKILILESCTHQVSCDDIGRIKIPLGLEKYTGKKLNFDIVSGLSPVDKNIEQYSLIIQCGGCMITQKQLTSRLLPFINKNIPVSNYGMTLAYINGIFKRAIKPFISLK